MGSMSNYLESGVFQHFLRTGSISKPSTLAIALCSGVLDDTNTGVNLPEIPNASNYSRIDLGGPADATWDYQGLTGATQNTAAITSSVASADWPTLSGIAICDSATYGAGNVLFWGYLDRHKTVQSGDSFTFRIGNLDITID